MHKRVAQNLHEKDTIAVFSRSWDPDWSIQSKNSSGNLGMEWQQRRVVHKK